MPARTLVVGCALAALGVSACGSTTNPVAGSNAAHTLAGALTPGRGVVDDPRTKALPCLRKLSFGVLEQGATGLTVGSGSQQARIVFLPTPGGAQQAQISGSTQSAEVIGNALLYPQAMGDRQLKSVEDCLVKGVQG